MEVVKRERRRACVVGTVVSVPRTYFDTPERLFSENFHGSVKKLFGKVVYLFKVTNKVSVRWFDDSLTTVPSADVTIEADDAKVELPELVIMSTYDPPPPTPRDVNIVKKEGAKEVTSSQNVDMNVDMTVEPMINKIGDEIDSDSEKENMTPTRKMKKRLKKRKVGEKGKMEEKRTRKEKGEKRSTEKEERGGKGKGKMRLEQVIGKIKFHNIGDKRQSSRISMPQSTPQGTQENAISVGLQGVEIEPKKYPNDSKT